jgi:hypothetical protein
MMETVYDWLTLGIFSGLVVLFLQRSSQEDPQDSLWSYLGAGVGCAVSNYVGNEGYHFAAFLLILGTITFITVVLKPFSFGGQP